MCLRNFLFLIGLLLSQLFTVGYGQYRGTFFGRANFDFSVPFVFMSKYESLGDDNTVLGDYYYDQFSMPFYISLELAYLATFTKQHRLVGLWKVKYNDDPVNFIFTESTKTKISATQFNSQNLNNFILLKYIWQNNSFYEFSPSFHINFDLNRDSRYEEFIDNFYNVNIYGFFINFKMKNLGDSGSVLRRMIFNFDLGYSYNQLPNSEIKRNLASIPDTREDFQSVDFNFKYFYISPNLIFNAAYHLNFKAYVEKAVHSGSFTSGYTDDNQKDLNNNLDLSFYTEFLDQGEYKTIGLTIAFSLGYFNSSHMELVEISRGLEGNYPLPSTAVFANNLFLFYQGDFKNYFSSVAGLYLKLNVNPNHGFQLGYTFGLKRFMNEYGRTGSGLNVDPTGGNVSSSGAEESFPIDSYGIYTDEKRQDLFHTVSASYIWRSKAKDRSLYPWLGVQRSSSNDMTKKLNRYIFILGFRVSYEF